MLGFIFLLGVVYGSVLESFVVVMRRELILIRVDMYSISQRGTSPAA